MKKYSLILALCCFFGGEAVANTTMNNDTTVHYRSKQIHIQDSVGQIKVRVSASNGEDFKKVYEGIFTDGKSYEKYTVVEDTGFNLSFVGKMFRSKKHNMNAHWAGIGWGFAGLSDNQMSSYNNVGGMQLKSQSSNEFYMNFMEKILPVVNDNFGITTGFGMGWHNYAMKSNVHLTMNQLNHVEVEPAVYNYNFNRLRTFQLTVPLLLELQPTIHNDHKSYISAGVVASFNVYTSYKVHYKDENGNNIDRVDAKDLNLKPINFDFMCQIGYGQWGLFAKYCPFSLFEKNVGPVVHPVSMGAVLNF